MQHIEIIEFWFDQIEPSQWWKKDQHFDNLIIERFTNIHAKATRCELFTWRQSNAGRLAEIIILDQFSRNMFRGSAQAFANDSLALALAQEAVGLGVDLKLNIDQRAFLYLPFMHSESPLVHDEALKLYTDNAAEASLRFEIRHRDIILRFGRYPHRNKLLGRISSQEELDFLAQPGSRF